jgi:hypothetical protein
MIGKYIFEFKKILLDLLDTSKIMNGLLFLFVILVLQTFSTNIETYDCEFANMYFDNSYICVIQQYAEYFKGFISAIDEKDLTEIDEILILVAIYFIGYLIHYLAETIMEFFYKHRNTNMYIQKSIWDKYVSKISHVLALSIAILLYIFISDNMKAMFTGWVFVSFIVFYFIYRDIKLNKLILFSDKNTLISENVISDTKIEKILEFKMDSNILTDLTILTDSKKEFIEYLTKQNTIIENDEMTETIKSLTDSEYVIMKNIFKYKNN